MTFFTLLFGQLIHAVLRTAVVSAIANDKKLATMLLNMVANLVRLVVLAGGVVAVNEQNW